MPFLKAHTARSLGFLWKLHPEEATARATTSQEHWAAAGTFKITTHLHFWSTSATTNSWYNLTITPFQRQRWAGEEQALLPPSRRAAPLPAPAPRGLAAVPAAHWSCLLLGSQQLWELRDTWELLELSDEESTGFPMPLPQRVSCAGEHGGLLPASAYNSLKAGQHFMQCIVSLHG